MSTITALGMSVAQPTVTSTYEFFALEGGSTNAEPTVLTAQGLPSSDISHIVEAWRDDYSNPKFVFKVLESTRNSAICSVYDSARKINTVFSLTVMNSFIEL